jgi:hypothetical protein
VVFRPLAGEILQGRIRSCSEKGLFVTMGFFEDIVVPPTEMQPDTHFDAKEQLWVWKYGDAELFMEIDEVTARGSRCCVACGAHLTCVFLRVVQVIHFRVVRGDFHDITPGAAAMGPDGDADPDKELQSPYVLTVGLIPNALLIQCVDVCGRANRAFDHVG